MPDYEFQETFSVNKVREICALSKHLSGQDIRYNDKSISWDGNILYYRGDRGTKIGKEYIIPVQVKGKKVEQFDDEVIFRIKREDLDNYFNNNGIIFFLGETLYDGTTRLYAKLLLQIDIIRLIRKNDNRKTIPVKLEYIHSFEALEEMCNVYIDNFSKQSILIVNPNILENPVHFLESANEGEFTFDISLSNDAKKCRPEIAILRSKYAYFYINKEGLRIPIDIDSKRVFIRQEFIRHFSLAGIYEEDLMVEYIHTRDATDMIIQKILKFHIEPKNESISIHITDGNEVEFGIMYKAAHFILNFLEYGGMLMDNCSFIPNNQAHENIKKHFSKPQFKEYFKSIIYIGEMLDSLNISKDYFITGELLNDSKRLFDLYNLLTHKDYVKISDKSKNMQIGKFSLANRVIFLQVHKNDNDKYEADDLFGSRWELLVHDEDSSSPSLSCYWLYIDPECISDCLIDREKMIRELSEIENLCDDPLFERIMEDVIFLINDYDKSQRRRNIEFAIELLNIVRGCAGELDSVIVNYLQIKKRISKLDDMDREKLIVLKNGSDNAAACCACVLLEQWAECRNKYLNFKRDEQEAFCSWPIYNLVPDKYKVTIQPKLE